MQIALRAAKVDLVIREPAKPVANRGNLAREHRRIRDHHDIGSEQRFVLSDELVEVQAADLFFSLEKHLDVQRQLPGLFHVRFDRLEVHEHLPLVVGRPARINLVLAHGGFEGRRLPQVDRIHRLHVVVTVEEDRRRARRVQPFTVDDRIAWRFEQPHVLEADALHVVGAPFGRATHIALVLRKRADARDGEILLQLVDVSISLHIDVVNDLVDVFHSWFLIYCSRGPTPARFRSAASRLTQAAGASGVRWEDRHDLPTLSKSRCNCERESIRSAAARDRSARRDTHPDST